MLPLNCWWEYKKHATNPDAEFLCLKDPDGTIASFSLERDVFKRIKKDVLLWIIRDNVSKGDVFQRLRGASSVRQQDLNFLLVGKNKFWKFDSSTQESGTMYFYAPNPTQVRRTEQFLRTPEGKKFLSIVVQDTLIDYTHRGGATGSKTKVN